MGNYSDKIVAQQQAAHMSAEQIAAAKNQRCKARNNARRAARRNEAALRNTEWADKTVVQQLAALDLRRGQSRKQKARIIKNESESK